MVGKHLLLAREQEARIREQVALVLPGSPPESGLAGDCLHLPVDSLDLAPADFVNLARAEVQRRVESDEEFVDRLAIGQAGRRQSRTRRRRVLLGKECCQLPPSRLEGFAIGLRSLRSQFSATGFGDAFGEVAEGPEQRRLLRGRRRLRCQLADDDANNVLRLHRAFSNCLAERLDVLVDIGRDGSQAGEHVLVVPLRPGGHFAHGQEHAGVQTEELVQADQARVVGESFQLGLELPAHEPQAYAVPSVQGARVELAEPCEVAPDSPLP